MNDIVVDDIYIGIKKKLIKLLTDMSIDISVFDVDYNKNFIKEQFYNDAICSDKIGIIFVRKTVNKIIYDLEIRSYLDVYNVKDFKISYEYHKFYVKILD